VCADCHFDADQHLAAGQKLLPGPYKFRKIITCLPKPAKGMIKNCCKGGWVWEGLKW